jgi:hypothetical protein
MALNLWKVNTGKTSYNPMPQFGSLDVNLGIGDFVLLLNAKSASNGNLRVRLAGISNSVYPLTSVSKKFTFDLKTSAITLLQISDSDAKGDIIIDSIELIQKPLPKRTINGFDDMLESGSITTGAGVNDNSAGALNSQIRSVNYCAINPNQQLVLSDSAKTSDIRVFFYDANKSFVSTLTSLPSTPTFTSPSNAYFMKFRLNSTDLNLKVVLNLGSIPAPYEKKRGDRMVMPVAKKNLIPMFSSSKWTQVSGNTIQDDRTLIINTTAINQLTYVDIPALFGKSYVFTMLDSIPNGWKIDINLRDSTNTTNVQTNSSVSLPFSFTVTNQSASFIRILFYSPSVYGQWIIKQPQLEQSTVSTPYTPYAVQLNKKPQRYVPKKNLFDGRFDSGFFDNSAPVETLQVLSGSETTRWIPCKSNQDYVINGDNDRARWQVKNASGVITSVGVDGNFNRTVKTLSDSVLMRVYYSGATNTTTWMQIEEGTTATAYEPYQLILPKAKTGLSFNGVTDYLQIPSTTMDSIEIECLIDAVQSSSTPFLLEFRNTGTDPNDRIYFSGSTFIPQGIFTGVPDVGIGVRRKSKFSFTQRTVQPKVFSNYASSPGNLMKGILYKVTCYLAGAIVAQYDFEKPGNVVGDKVLQNAVNLIPSFEDARWSLHANTQVLGKDVLRLNATSGVQGSFVDVPVSAGTNYLLRILTTGVARGLIGWLDSSNAIISYSTIDRGSGITITPPSNIVKARVFLDNNGTTGSFDFIRPQLYQLDCKEGTLFGKPVQLLKVPKRQLYAKR